MSDVKYFKNSMKTNIPKQISL